jgi:uncharacterized protein YdaU (DUF1376 family)
MAKAPAFQFYPRDFLTDERVTLMSHTERGIYITLLCHCWLETSLPLEADTLAKMLNLPLKRFTALWEHSVVRTCFQVQEDGRLHHGRLDKEREKQAGFGRRQSDNANARWNKSGNATALPPDAVVAMPSQSPRVADSRLQTSFEQQAENEKNNADEATRFLERYQALYTKHRHGAFLKTKPNLDWSRVCELLAIWDFDRLEKLATILLTTDEPWVKTTDRGSAVFHAKASWCDGRLREWETANGVAV